MWSIGTVTYSGGKVWWRNGMVLSRDGKVERGVVI